jgi:hypothetical protein
MNFLDGGISMKFVAEFRYCSLILLAPAHVVTTIKQPPVLKGHLILVLS